MVKKLAEAGYVTHSPYQGVALTERGEKAALEMLRHHRLLETFLSEHLGMPWHEVHAEADRLEHALSETLEDRLDAILGHPTVDPHGAPIPTKDGTVSAPVTTTLWATVPETVVWVAEVEDEDANLLTHFADLGLVPGARVEVLKKGPFGGPLHIRVAGREHALGEIVASAVLVASDYPSPQAILTRP
jgi:DtxR family transcriptional regulator, Mn-dependent transcriptional regulator